MAFTGLTGPDQEYVSLKDLPGPRDAHLGPNPQLHLILYIINFIIRALKVDQRTADRFATSLGCHINLRLQHAYRLSEDYPEIKPIYQLIVYMYGFERHSCDNRADIIKNGLTTFAQCFDLKPEGGLEEVKEVFIGYLLGQYPDYLPSYAQQDPESHPVIYRNTIGLYLRAWDHCERMLSWHGPDYDSIS